jgi:hypothetical protein
MWPRARTLSLNTLADLKDTQVTLTMPPKRKAAAAPAIEPPTKRQTRNGSPAKPQPASSEPASRKARGRPRAVEQVAENTAPANKGGDEAAKEVEEDGSIQAGVTRSRVTVSKLRGTTNAQPKQVARTTATADASEAPRKRGRPPGKKAVQVQESDELPQPSSSKVTIESLQNLDAGASEDELLLKSPRKMSTRSTTPPKQVGSVRTNSTPRFVMDHVEVPTPSKKMREIQNFLSPKVTSPSRPAALPFKALPLRASTPTQTAPGSKTSAVRTPPSRLEENVVPALVPPPSPSKALPATPNKSPNRGKAVATLQASPSRLPRSLPSHLHHYLGAQKRATLRALQEISVLPGQANSTEGSGEEAGPSTNEVAYEQMCSLLKGTVERGEGNSCMVIGPRGSGKTQASLTFIIRRHIASH